MVSSDAYDLEHIVEFIGLNEINASMLCGNPRAGRIAVIGHDARNVGIFNRLASTPSIVPGDDQDVYLVEDDLGHWGRVWTETDSGSTDLETVIVDMLSGQYRNPVRVIAFNVSEGWCWDASKGVAIELRRHCDQRGRKLPAWLEGFVDRHRSETS